MQWRERAIVMAAALAARNYEGDNRAEIEMWSRPILQRAATQAADRRAGKEYRRHLDDAIGAEQRWLEGQATEPDWPTLPIWPSRRRRGIRLGPAAWEDDELTTRIAVPDVYIDENAIGTLVDHLADLGRGSVDEWRLNLAHHLLAWTDRANNGPPEDGEDHDREHRPDRWNAHFFYFLGFLCGAVAFERSQPLFLEPIIRLNDEAFHDALAPLLNGLDQATPLDRSGIRRSPLPCERYLPSVSFADGIGVTWPRKNPSLWKFASGVPCVRCFFIRRGWVSLIRGLICHHVANAFPNSCRRWFASSAPRPCLAMSPTCFSGSLQPTPRRRYCAA